MSFKNHFNLVIVLGILVSCSSRNEVIESAYENGDPKLVKIYEGNLMTEQKSYYPGKIPEVEGKFDERGLKSGLWKYWYDNGNIWTECEFSNGLRNGKTTVYYKEGTKRYTGQYKNDDPIGVWVFYDTKGNEIKKLSY